MWSHFNVLLPLFATEIDHKSVTCDLTYISLCNQIMPDPKLIAIKLNT